MKHHFLDHYWNRKSFIHPFDPRIKIILSAVFLLAVVSTPNGQFTELIFFVPLAILLLVYSKLPLTSILKRMLTILPIAILIGLTLPFVTPGKPLISLYFLKWFTITDQGILNFISIVIKASLAVWIMTLLTATTRFSDLITAMQGLKFPKIFTTLLGFIYRYIFLFIDEVERLNIGRRSRSFGSKPVIALKGFGWMISSLLLKSFERAERIYQAMCARGFDGTFISEKRFKTNLKEIIFSAAFIIIVLLIKLLGCYYD